MTLRYLRPHLLPYWLRTRWLAAAASAAALSGCLNLAPHYARPAAPVPTAWPNASAAATEANAQTNANAAEIGWREFFRDPRLRDTIALALANNRDLRIAVLDIEKERAEYHIERASLFPAIDLGGSGDAERTPASVKTSASNGTNAEVTHVYSANLGFSAYEIDFFGRVRNLSREALETYLSTVETRRSTQLTLVAEVASDWLTLAADQRLLDIAQQTYASQQQTYALTQQEHQLGAIGGLEDAEAQSALQSARNDVAADTTTVAQARNALNLVGGTTVPDADLPDARVDAVSALAALPAGIPSNVLQQRPDVLAAEHTLKAANADIGAARANFFPRIDLTAALGFESPALSALFQGANRAWSFEPSITLPIFDGGANLATLDAAKATQNIDVAAYEKTIQTAFAEVADALATRATIAEQLDAQDKTVAADQRGYTLAMALYRQGSYSLLDALTQQRLLYTAQQSQVATQLNAQTSLITLYKALGGGGYEHTTPVEKSAAQPVAAGAGNPG